MKRFLTCLPLCFSLMALPALAGPHVPAALAMACGAGEPAVDVSMMTRHAALKFAAEHAIAAQQHSPCHEAKASANRHGRHAGHGAEAPSAHRHANAGGAGGKCMRCAACPVGAAALPTLPALTALPELMLAHHGLAARHAPLAALADAAPASQPRPSAAHC
jgi:hypothetical protein